MQRHQRRPWRRPSRSRPLLRIRPRPAGDPRRQRHVRGRRGRRQPHRARGVQGPDPRRPGRRRAARRVLLLGRSPDPVRVRERPSPGDHPGLRQRRRLEQLPAGPGRRRDPRRRAPPAAVRVPLRGLLLQPPCDGGGRGHLDAHQRPGVHRGGPADRRQRRQAHRSGLHEPLAGPVLVRLPHPAHGRAGLPGQADVGRGVVHRSPGRRSDGALEATGRRGLLRRRCQRLHLDRRRRPGRQRGGRHDPDGHVDHRLLERHRPRTGHRLRLLQLPGAGPRRRERRARTDRRMGPLGRRGQSRGRHAAAGALRRPRQPAHLGTGAGGAAA